MGRIWEFIITPPRRLGLGLVLLIGGVGGIIFWGGFNTFMEMTNKLDFCISCHEMEQTVYKEYVQSIHYKNPSGVRATCPDCHVPREWGPKVLRKIKASNELYHKLLGSIDTPEKFEAKRFQLAKNVWAAMEANDSHECRNCHAYDAMHFEKQRKRAQEKMEVAAKEGKTCISCHKGIAHKLPPEAMLKEEEEEDVSRPAPAAEPAQAAPARSMKDFLKEE